MASPESVRKAWSVRRVLDAWGACVLGSEPIMPGIGYPTRRTPDPVSDEGLAYERVCRLPGYRRAYPVLSHHVARGRPLESFRVVWPGETVRDAMDRLGWRDFLIYPPSDTLLVQIEDMAWWRWQAFLIELRADLEAEPYCGGLREVDAY